MLSHWQFISRGRCHRIPLPCVMGIINCTPDSFFSGSRVTDAGALLLEKAEQMIREGAAILDLGAESTRPGAEPVDIKEELQRLIPAIQRIRKHFPDILISADTRHTEVAQAAYEAGADMINDISAGASAGMIDFVAKHRVPYIMMHMRGTPADMAQYTQYEDVAQEVLYDLAEKINILRGSGATDLAVDPGFGFAKTIDQNHTLLKHIHWFNSLEVPLVIGISRKSMIYKRLGITAAEALNGTTVFHTQILQQVPAILRVHDVKEACEVIALLDR